MRLKKGVMLLWILVFFTGCSESAYNSYALAIENSKTLKAVHHLWVTDLSESAQVNTAQEVISSPLKENYSEVRHYWATLLDGNSVSEKDKTVVKTPRGDVKVIRYKVHPSSELVEAFESYLKGQNLISAYGQIISYEEEGLVNLDGNLVETQVSFVVEVKANPKKQQKWKIISQYEFEKGGL